MDQHIQTNVAFPVEDSNGEETEKTDMEDNDKGANVSDIEHTVRSEATVNTNNVRKCHGAESTWSKVTPRFHSTS